MTMEHRTYKTSLRAPASLVEGLAGLVVEREVLRYLQARPGGDFDGFCCRKRGLRKASAAAKERYRLSVDAWRTRVPAEIDAALVRNTAALAGLKRQDPAFAGGSLFTKATIGAASGTATPDPAIMSLHDYCRLAGESLKMTCAHVDSVAREVIPMLPASFEILVNEASARAVEKGNAITEGSLRAYPEKAIAHFLGRHGNVELTAFEQVAAMMEAYRDTRSKVELARGVLFDDGGEHEFPGAAPALLYTCTVPRHVMLYLAGAWGVEPGWVRNVLVGWRRKIDVLLPASCQVESLAKAFSPLAVHAKALAGGDDDELRAIGILERRRVLHLLYRGVDLSPLLDGSLRPAIERLRAKIESEGSIPAREIRAVGEHETAFSVPSLLAAAKVLSDDVATTMASLPGGSAAAGRCRAFLSKIDAIVEALPAIGPFLDHYLPGSRYTGAVARVLAGLPSVKARGVSRVFTALRGIIALAVAATNAEATARFRSAFVPDACVTRPCMSPRRKKRYLPVNLLFNKYVVLRKEHPAAKKVVDGKDKEAFLDNDGATDLLREGKPAWLGIPIYAREQFDEATRRLSGTRKGVFWFELVPTGPIMARLARGARVESIRLEVPRGPTRKIVADVILASEDPRTFAGSTRFIDAMDASYHGVSFPRDEWIGSDLNALGPHAIALGTTTSTIDLHAGPNVMAPIEHAAKRIEAVRREIVVLQRAIDAGGAGVTRSKNGRRPAQLAMLHERLGRLRADAERRVLMVYLYALHRTGAAHASWDAVEVTTRGTRGSLAIAITTMPKRRDLMAIFERWAFDLVDAGKIGRFEGVIPVSPYTGGVCDECFARTGEARRTRKIGIPYHAFECVACGRQGDRHEVSARVAALLLQHAMNPGTGRQPARKTNRDHSRVSSNDPLGNSLA
jgi:hypothetical protein